VHYLDPKVAACVIFRWEGGIFLLRRSIAPGYGRWTYPGGYVDRGETVEAAAVRETREEAGCGVHLDDLLGVYSYPGQTAIILVYRGTIVEGTPRAVAESLEARSFVEKELPWEGLAFPSTVEALRDYLAAERREGPVGISRNAR
jgi:ADP-ribose pyrophosphatase YjhB (NUDIX family)